MMALILTPIRTLNDMDFTDILSVDCVPARPDWKTMVQKSIRFMKGMEAAAELQIAVMN